MVEPHSSNLRVITTNFLGVRIRATENRFFAGLDRFLVCKTDSFCIKHIFFGPKKHTLRIIYWPNYSTVRGKLWGYAHFAKIINPFAIYFASCLRGVCAGHASFSHESLASYVRFYKCHSQISRGQYRIFTAQVARQTRMIFLRLLKGKRPER